MYFYFGFKFHDLTFIISLFIISFFHSFILSFFHSFILSFFHSFILSFFHSFILSFFHSFILFLISLDLVDWFPTLASVAEADVNVPGKPVLPLDGYNMWESIAQNKASPRNIILHSIFLFISMNGYTSQFKSLRKRETPFFISLTKVIKTIRFEIR